MDIKSIIGQSQERQFQLDSIRSVNEKERTVEVAFASEAMVPMWYGMESLSHDTGAADFSRIADGGSVIMDHDEVRWVGAIRSARIDQDRKSRAVIQFGQNSLANDVWPDVASGLRKLVSFRYRVLDAIPANTEDGAEYIKVTRWQPLEISFVSVPADASVGVGRSLAQSQQHIKSMPENNTQDTGGQTATQQAPANQNQAPQSQRSATTQTAPHPQAPQSNQAQPGQTQQPQQRDLSANVVITGGEAQRANQLSHAEIVEIRYLAERYGAIEDGFRFVTENRSVNAFKDHLLERARQNDAAHKNGKTMLGLSPSEQRQYSFLKAMRVAAFPHSQEFRNAAGYELECSRATQQIWGQSDEFSISIPPEILMSEQSYRSLMGNLQGQRAFNVSAGPGAIDKGTRPQDFVELLRNLTLGYQLGVQFIGDVVGNPYVPKHTSASAAEWVTEDADATTADDAIGQTQINPKHVSATTYLTRSMLLQDSIGVESMLVASQFENIAEALDKAIFHGTGSSGQPTGLAAASIGSVAIGTNGGNLTYAKALEFMTDVETANALFGNIAYVTTPGVKAFAMQTLKTSGISGYLWEPMNNTINGYPAYATNQIASNLTKGTSSGVCHAMFYGNFRQMIVFGWGPLEFMRDQYSKAVKGGVNLVSFQSVDLFIRQLGAFSGCLDLTIT